MNKFKLDVRQLENNNSITIDGVEFDSVEYGEQISNLMKILDLLPKKIVLDPAQVFCPESWG